MADATVAFRVEDQASGPAQSAATALETLTSAVTKDTAALKSMSSEMKALGNSSSDLGGGLKQIKPPTKELKGGDDALKSFMETAKGGLGPMGGLFERFQMLKTGGPAAVFIAAWVAVIALGAAIVATTIEMMKFSLAAADAGLKQRLAFGSVANAAGVKELEAVVSKLSSKLPSTSAEIAKFAQKEYEAGKRGSELEKAVASASLAAAGLGKNAKLGSEAAMKAMLPMETQIMKAKDNWSRLFSGVKVEGFEKALKSVLDLLDENSSTGKALKAIFEGMMNPLFDSLSAGGPAFKAFFKQIVIMSLMVAIAVKQVGQAISEAFSGSGMSGMDAIQAGILAAKVVFYALAVAIGVVVVVAGLFIFGVAAAFMTVAGGIVAVVAVVVGVIAALGYAFVAAYDFVTGLDWGGVASGLIDGLVNGIVSGGARVLAAVQNLGSSMVSTIKSALDSHSPSKAFYKVGGFTTDGMAEGIDDGAKDVNASVAKMVQIPDAAGKKGEPGSAGKSSAGGGNVISITVNAEGGKAEDIATACRKAVLDALEAVAFSQGMVPA